MARVNSAKYPAEYPTEKRVWAAVREERPTEIIFEMLVYLTSGWPTRPELLRIIPIRFGVYRILTEQMVAKRVNEG